MFAHSRSGRSTAGSRWRRAAAFAGATAVAFSSLVVATNVASAPSAAAVAPFPINDTTPGASGTVNTHWTVLPGSTGSPGRYTSDGWTRITNSADNQKANLINGTAFPSSSGITVTFDYRAAGGTTLYDNPLWGDGTNKTADGIAMYLFDGRVDGSASLPYRAGAAGAGLGYAGGGSLTTEVGTTCTSDNARGVLGGYLGLGIDTFGNFGVARRGQAGGTTKNEGPVYALRGSSAVDYTKDNCATPSQSYPLLASRKASAAWTGLTNDTRDPASYVSNYRRVRVSVTPVLVNGVQTVRLTAAISGMTQKNAQPTGSWTVITDKDITGPTQAPLPPTLKLGFSGSTGDGTDYHDIRNITVQANTDASIAAAMNTTGSQGGKYAPGEAVKMTYTATNLGPTTIGDAPNGQAKVYTQLPAGLAAGATWTCTPTGGAACGSASGTVGADRIINVDWTGPKGSKVDIAVSGKAVPVAGTYAGTAVVPVNSDIKANPSVVDVEAGPVQADRGATDIDTKNNSAPYSFDVVTPTFTQTKTVSASQLLVGQAVTYTIKVKNTGAMAGTASVADVVPDSVKPTALDCTVTDGSCTKGLTGQELKAADNIATLPAGAEATYTITGTATKVGGAQNSATIVPTTAGCDVTPNSCGGGTAPTGASSVVTASIDVAGTVIDKATSAYPTGLKAGQVLTYTYTVTNNGVFPLASFSLDQGKKAGDVSLPAPTCAAASLAPGASTTCTVDYVVKQADIDNGVVANTFAAVGQPQGAGAAAVTSADRTLTVDDKAGRKPGLSMVATATPVDGDATATPNPTTVNSTKDAVKYTYTLTNTGNVTITGAGVDITAFSGSPKPTVTCESTSIAPGASVTCTATVYNVTQADLDAGTITQTARPQGTSSAGAPTLADAKTTVTVASLAKLSSTLSVNPTEYAKVGDKLTYTLSVKNEGNVTASSIKAVPGAFDGDANGLSATTCQSTTLAPGASTDCTFTYTVTQADLDRGSVTAHATATGTGANGVAVQSPDSSAKATAKVDVDGKLAVSGTLGTPDPLQAGGKSPVSFTVTNNSNVTLSGVDLNASVKTGNGTLSAIDCTPKTLAPGQSATCTGTYTATQADIDRGSIAITGTATAKTPGGATVTAPAVDASATFTAASALKTEAELVGNAPKKAGDTVTIKVTTTNDGKTTLTKVGNELKGFSGDASALQKTCTPSGTNVTLAPGEKLECTYTYKVTQKDADAGVLTATPSSSATAPDGTSVTKDGAQLSIPFAGQAAELGVSFPNQPTFKDTTTPVTLTVRVTNNGDVTLKDPKAKLDAWNGALPAGALECPAITALAPGDYLDCTIAYTPTQADLDRGSITATASATAAKGDGTEVKAAPATAKILAEQASKITATGTLDTSGVKRAGDVATMTIKGTNPGNTTLTEVTVPAPTFVGGGAVGDVVCTVNGTTYTNATFTLAPGQSYECTVKYTTTQKDLDAGQVALKDPLTVTGQGPEKKVSATVDPAGDGSTGPITETAKLDVLAKAAPGSVSSPQDKVTYTVTVTNSGNTTLKDVVLDPRASTFGGKGTLGDLVCKDAVDGKLSLAPGASADCTVTYTPTQDDINGEGWDFAATVSTATTASGKKLDPVTSPVTRVATSRDSKINVTKSVVVPSPIAVNGEVKYTLTATNIGNTTLTKVRLTDRGFTGTNPGGLTALSCGSATNGEITLQPGEHIDCTVTYQLTQADIDAGSLKNGLHGEGVAPDKTVSDDTDADTEASLTGATNGLSMTGGPKTTEVTRAGDQVTYEYTVTNTGARTVSGAKVSIDKGSSTGSFGPVVCTPGGTDTVSLAAGASVTCTVTYTVSQADMDGGDLIHTAKVEGKASNGDPVTATVPPTPVKTTDNNTLALKKEKTSPEPLTTVGQKIEYTVTATNGGSTTLNNINVTDTGVQGGTGQLDFVKCTVGSQTQENGTISLAPGQSAACVWTYTLTQADLDAASIKNGAKGTAEGPGGAKVETEAPVNEVSSTKTPAIKVSKAYTGPQITKLGDPASFTITTKNTGNTTLRDVSVKDVGFEGVPEKLTGPTCTVDQQPADNGTVTLAPGQSVSCDYTYEVQQSDFDRGTLKNGAETQGTDPAGTVVTDKTTAATGAEANLQSVSQLKTTKTSKTETGPDFTTISKLNELVTYTVTVQNTGNTTVSKVTAADVDFTGSGPVTPGECKLGDDVVTNGSLALAPGQSVSCSFTYRVSQQDLDGTGLSNNGLGKGTTPGGKDVEDKTDDPTVTPSSRQPGITSSVSATTEGGAAPSQAGDKVTYRLKVTNSGNTSLTAADVKPAAQVGDGTLKATTCQLLGLDGTTVLADGVKAGETDLLPGQSLSCTYEYTLTQADIDRGEVSLASSASAKDRTAGALTASGDKAVVKTERTSGLKVTKTATPATFKKAGDEIEYTITAENTGTVTLSKVKAEDTGFTGADPSKLVAGACLIRSADNSTKPATNGDATLLPGQSLECVFTYTVQQADLDGNGLSNSAKVTGEGPTGPIEGGTDEPTPVKPVKASAIDGGVKLTPQTDDGKVSRAGDKVEVVYTATNTGNTSLGTVNITPDTFTGTNGPLAFECKILAADGKTVVKDKAELGKETLKPGETLSCTAIYTVSQRDVDNGGFKAGGTVTGIDPEQKTVTDVIDPDGVGAGITIENGSGIKAAKSVNYDDPATAEVESKLVRAGQHISYVVTAKNTGNTTLRNVLAEDTGFTGAGTLQAPVCTIQPGNTAGINGSATLVPGETLSCVYGYTVAQADLDAAKGPSNLAKATGTDPKDDKIIDETTEPVVPEIGKTPKLTVTKAVDTHTTGADEGKIVKVGQELTYTLTAKNTGNQTLKDVKVEDTGFTGSGALVAAGCLIGGAEATNGSATLAPGESLVCTFTYTVTQKDLDGPGLSNAAKGTAKDPGGGGVTDETEDPTVTPSSKTSKIEASITKTPPFSKAGEVIDYTVTMKNTGNQSVDQLTLTPEGATGTGAFDKDVLCTLNGKQVPLAEVSLASGQSVECVVKYTVTQADVDSTTGITTGAKVLGKDPADKDVTAVAAPQDPTAAPRDSTLLLTKSASVDSVAAKGDTITYTITATNAGLQTAKAVKVADVEFTGTGTLDPLVCVSNGKPFENGAGDLLPGQAVSCTLTYTVTQEDIDGDGLSNAATADFTNPGGEQQPQVKTEEPTVVKTDGEGKLKITKSASRSEVSQVGDEIVYTLTATNQGKVTLKNVLIEDTDFTGKGTLGKLECTLADGTEVANGKFTLAVGDSASCTVTYSITQQDLDSGDPLTNSAKVTGTLPQTGGGEVTATPETTPKPVEVTKEPRLEVSKSADTGTADGKLTGAGQTITYTIVGKNTGNQTLTDVTLEDTGFTGTGALSAPVCTTGTAPNTEPATNGKITLAPGASASCVVTYTVTQADMDGAGLSNAAKSTGKDPDGGGVTDETENPTVTPPDRAPKLETSLGADATELKTAGQPIVFTMDTKNTGNTTIDGISMAPDAFTGTGQLGAPTCTVLDKDGKEKATGVQPTGVSLAPGETLRCTYAYTATQQDVDSDGLGLSAKGSGTAKGGAAVEAIVTPVTVKTVHEVKQELTKSTDKKEIKTVGEVVNYTITLKNLGNVSLHDVRAEDVDFTGTGGPLSFVWKVVNTADGTVVAENVENGKVVLAPGQSLVGTAAYGVTQADIDGDGLSNQVTSTATDPGGTEHPETGPGPTETPSEKDSSVAVTKTVNVDDPATPAVETKVERAGQTIAYAVSAQNTGNTTLKNVMVSDDDFTGTGQLVQGECSVDGGAPVADRTSVTLLPDPKGAKNGQKLTCIWTYVVTQADMDGKGLSNLASATGQGPDKPVEEKLEEPNVTSVDHQPGVSTAITVTPTHISGAGQDTPFTVTVTNTGNTTLSDLTGAGAWDEKDLPGHAPVGTLTFSQPKAKAAKVGVAAAKAAADLTPAASGTIPRLAPGQSVTGTIAYTANQADVNAGAYQMFSTVTGTSAVTSSTVNAVSEVGAKVTSELVLDATITKTVNPASVDSGTPAYGGGADTVNYTITAKNTGTVALSNVKVADTGFTGAGALGEPVCSIKDAAGKVKAEGVANDGTATLNPGESLECVIAYTATQADLDGAGIQNGASLQATGPSRQDDGTVNPATPIERSTEKPTTLAMEHQPAIDVALEVSPNTITRAGDEVTYRATVTNTGNVTLGQIALDRLKTTGTGATGAPACTVKGEQVDPATVKLAPGEQLECQFTYTATQADVDGPDVVASISATAMAPESVPQAQRTAKGTSPEVTVRGAGTEEMVVSKSANVSKISDAGQKITYTISAKNNGTKSLTNVDVKDAKFSGTGKLESPVCTVKGAGPNEGTVLENGAIGLAPGQWVECRFGYSVTQADLDSGELKNSAAATSGDSARGLAKAARVSATLPEGETVILPTDERTGFVVTKTSDLSQLQAKGQKIKYTVSAKNTGNTTVEKVTLDDTDFSGSGKLTGPTCTAGGKDAENGSISLAPGQSVDCVFGYTVTQADIDSGSLQNSAVGTGVTSLGTDVKGATQGAYTVEVTKAAGLTVTKTATEATLKAPGEKITYTLSALNSGNATLRNVRLEDTNFGGTGELKAVGCFIGDQPAEQGATLEPGQRLDCRFEYVTTREDVLAGTLSNGAHGTGTNPGGGGIKDDTDDPTVIKNKDEGKLEVNKVASTQLVQQAGDTITYTITAKNVGEGPLKKVSLRDVNFTGAGTLSPLTCTDAQGAEIANGSITLVPGESATCVTIYTVVKADLGQTLSNGAYASGETPGGKKIEDDSDNPNQVAVNPAPAPQPTPQPPLVNTGAAVTGLLIAAGALIVIGLVFFLLRRRRNEG